MDKNKILYYLKSKQQYYYDNFGIKFIGIFGSFARDEMNRNSDIDILYKIESNKKLSMFKYLKINSLLEEFFNKKIDLVRFETFKPAIKKYVEKDLIYV
jgi:predicted nucleotidyltransferase